jgi:hypothetical protein
MGGLWCHLFGLAQRSFQGEKIGYGVHCILGGLQATARCCAILLCVGPLPLCVVHID